MATSTETITGNQDVATRDSATLKVLYHDCGCRKHVCLCKGDSAKKPCTISCRKCKDDNSYDPCPAHSRIEGYVKDRRVIAREYFI